MHFYPVKVGRVVHLPIPQKVLIALSAFLNILAFRFQ